jgi:hypothetical protein
MFCLIGCSAAAWWLYRRYWCAPSEPKEDATSDAESWSVEDLTRDEVSEPIFARAMLDVNTTEHDEINTGAINPANGLPMVGCVDIAGNVYGTDSAHQVFQDDSFLSSNRFDDTFSSSSHASFDD